MLVCASTTCCCELEVENVEPLHIYTPSEAVVSMWTLGEELQLGEEIQATSLAADVEPSEEVQTLHSEAAATTLGNQTTSTHDTHRQRSSAASATDVLPAEPSTRLSARFSSLLKDIRLLDDKVVHEIAESHPMVRSLVSFDGNAQLLRASRLTHVMRGGAAVLANRAGSADTYAMSEEVRQIAVFISHNWVVARIKKLLCLALHFNFHSALIVATLVATGVVAAIGLGLLPEAAAAVLVAPVFVLLFFFGHNVGFPGRCRRSPMVFLDKTCIHQTDSSLQREGILKLGAFIHSSEHMVVIYTDVYLTKLWTVYEVACFLCQHPVSRMSVIPTYLPMLIMVGISLLYMTFLIHIMLFSLFSFRYTQHICLLLMSFALATVLRVWARTKVAIHHRLKNFEVQACTCYCEDDRVLVHRNISLLMRAVGLVGADADDEATLAAFNQLVRRRLSDVFISCVGRFGLSYLQIVSLFMCTSLPISMAYAAAGHLFGGRMTPVQWVSWSLYTLTWELALKPLCCAFLAWWCGACLQLRGWKEFVFLGAGCFIMMLGGFGAFFLLDPMWHRNLLGVALTLASLEPLAISAFNCSGVSFRKWNKEIKKVVETRDEAAWEEADMMDGVRRRATI